MLTQYGRPTQSIVKIKERDMSSNRTRSITFRSHLKSNLHGTEDSVSHACDVCNQLISLLLPSIGQSSLQFFHD